MEKPVIELSKEKIAEFCRRHHIRKLSVFGSFLTDDFGAGSDIDLLARIGARKLRLKSRDKMVVLTTY